MDKNINITLNPKGELNIQADGPSEIEAYGMLVTALFIIKSHNKGEISETQAGDGKCVFIVREKRGGVIFGCFDSIDKATYYIDGSDEFKIETLAVR